jgi:hypothetical protein
VEQKIDSLFRKLGVAIDESETQEMELAAKRARLAKNPALRLIVGNDSGDFRLNRIACLLRPVECVKH